MSKHLAFTARKTFLLTGRNVEQNLAVGGRPFALTGWAEREKGDKCSETQT